MTEPLPAFVLQQPDTVDQAIAAVQAEPDGRFLAGGTDLIVNMRRGLLEPQTLIDLTGIPELCRLDAGSDGLSIGAAVTLREICQNESVDNGYGAISQACQAVAGPGHRNAATVGGNLCLDTRCFYYNQSSWWRSANDFCLKYNGDTCHVAPAGKRCRAAFSGDLAPALMVHDANVDIAGPEERRRTPLTELYREDGADHLRLSPGEFIVAIHVPPSDPANCVSAYGKIRVRGAIDFPLAGAAVACRKEADGTMRISVALTGTNSHPFKLEGFDPVLPDMDPTAALGGLEKLIQKQVSPQRTTTVAAHYRRLAVSALACRLAKTLLSGFGRT